MVHFGSSTIHRRRPRSGPLRSVLLDPRQASTSPTSSRRAVSGRNRTMVNSNKNSSIDSSTNNIGNNSNQTSKSHRGHSYPREMLDPVYDVVDSGLRGEHHGFNHALLRDGMWRELEPLIALKILRGDSLEEYEDNVIQLQEQPGSLDDEDGIEFYPL